MNMRWVVLLAFLPSALFYSAWKGSWYFIELLGCHIAKSGTRPCIYNGMELSGWLGGSGFFGMVGFLLSIPLAGIFVFEIWFGRRLAKRSKA